MKSQQKVSVRKERDVITYAEMWHSSDCLLKQGQEQLQGSTHQFRASLVFTAFTLEAYLNHVGPKLFRCWEDLERLGPKEKLNIIGEHLQLTIHYGIRPWQIMKQLFDFRNAIAHGKSKMKFTPPAKLVAPGKKEPVEEWLAKTEWEAFCTEQNAVRAREDVREIVNAIYQAAKTQGCDTGHPFMAGMQVRSEKLITKKDAVEEGSR